jgi:hypoxanthine phosphoribosyltransferase
MILFTEQEIQTKVKQIASQLNQTHHSSPPVYICVLNGAFMFFADLVKHVEPCYIDFIKAKSYENNNQYEVNILTDISSNISNKPVYLVDDIYDSGNTINHIIQHLLQYNPLSITPVTLFKRHTSSRPDLIYGFDLQDESFLVGYGLNAFDDTKRNLPYIEGQIFDE